MSSRDALVAERIPRLDAAIECRNALLHQLYELIRSRHNGTLLTEDACAKEDPGLASFLEKLDIKKDPSVGMISQFTDDELHAAVLSTITTSDTPQTPSNSTALEPSTPTTVQVVADTTITPSPAAAQNNTPVDAEMTDVIAVPTLPGTVIQDSTLTPEPKNLANGVPPPQTIMAEEQSAPAPASSTSMAMDTDQDVKMAQPAPSEAPVQMSTNGETAKQPPLFVPHLVAANVTPTISTASHPTLATPPATTISTNTTVQGMLEEGRADIFEAYKEPIVSKYEPNYTLPLLSTLPAEFKAKGASRAARQQKKKEKEREKQAAVGGGSAQEAAKKEKGEEFIPLGMNRWGAIIRSNPVFKKVSTATKSLTTRDWNVAMMELTVVKALERIEELKDGKWSFRQPKKQRGVGGLTKTHGDYLLDEMKWMRTDFREERKWKLAVAYAIGQSVLDWHESGTPEERLRRGICVFWKEPRTSSDNSAEIDSSVAQDHTAFAEGSALAMLNYDSENDDDDDDGEQEKEEEIKESAGEALEADLTSAANGTLQDDPFFQVKQEDVEQNVQAGEDSMAIDKNPSPPDNTPLVATDALRVDSSNPMLAASGSTSGENDAALMHNPKPGSAEVMAYNAIRESVAYSSEQKLFLDDTDISLCLDGFNSLSLEPSIADIFADLQPYTMLDPPPSNGDAEKKKGEKRSERTDPYKRNEDTTFSKLTPVVKMMHCKPTLLGPLQPARRWKGGKWINIDDGPLPGDYEKPSIKAEEVTSDLFDPHPSHRQIPPILTHNTPRRAREHEWTTQDDALLKSLVEKYFPNWPLIAECFNSMKPSVKSDRRWALDCKLRWDTHFAEKKEGFKPSEPAPPASSPSLSTRGTKRQAELIAAAATASITSGESKKRRRHLLVADTVRKTAKKRENSNKPSLNPRKSSGLHETHNQYASLRPITPAELSTKKQEREELLKRQEAERRSQLMAQRMGGMPVAIPANSAQLAAVRQGLSNGQPIPQIRTSQVNISQQQRLATPSSARIASPLTPQQARAMQAMGNLPQAQAQAFAAQQQAVVANGMANHLASPQHVPRDATSSPIAPPVAIQASPPRNSATPSNSSPIPLPAQVNPTAGVVPARPTSVAGMNAYYPVMQNSYTHDQYMRILQHAQQQQQHLAHQQQVAQQQAQTLQSPTPGQP